MALARVSLVLLLAVLVAAGPAQHRHRRERTTLSQCAQECSGMSTKYSYKTGHTYTYEFDSSNAVEVPQMRQHNRNVTQKATVEIAVLSQCEFQMKLTQIEVRGAEVPPHYERELKKNAIRFSFDDGRLESVCAADDEPTWVLNVKRSMLSALQNVWNSGNEMEMEEHDVNGRCVSVYNQFEQSDGSMHYERRRAPHSCRGASHMHGAVRTHMYADDSNSMELGDQAHHCIHKVSKDGVLKEARCVENHRFQPLDDSIYPETAVQATIRTHWRLLKQEQNVRDEDISFTRRQQITYDSSDMRYEANKLLAGKGKQLVQELCTSSADYIAKSTPSQFVRLVESMRGMSESELVTFIEQTQSTCKTAKKFVQDALPMCGSEECIKAMVDILKSNELSTSEQHSWYTSLAMVPRVSLDMIESLLPLLEQQDYQMRGVLGMSAMVHTYCAQHNERDCNDEEVVERFVQKLAARIPHECNVQLDKTRDVERVILTLKALGNIGATGVALNKVQKCMHNKDLPTAVRVAAIQAQRRVRCVPRLGQSPNSMLDLLEDDSDNVEVRINAFLSLMQCTADDEVNSMFDLLETIFMRLNNEQSQQVGAFMTSYLMARQRSTDPHHKKLRYQLEKREIPRRFMMDEGRFSSYSENGVYYPEANYGGNLAQSLIYVPGSYVPRSASLNLTAHLFGHSINFFEAGIRAEGMDHFVDKMFGPDGEVTNPSAQFDEESTKNAESAEYQKDAREFEQRTHYTPDERLALSMYARVFGDELLYFGFDDPKIMDTVRRNRDYKTLTDFFAKQREINYRSHDIFMDITKTIPTASGLPLRLQVTGASAINVEVSGKSDLRELTKINENNMDIDWTMKPSMALEIATSLYMNVGGQKTGFRLLSRLHTSTAIKSQWLIRDGRHFKYVLGLPQQQMSIADVEVTGVDLINGEEVALPGMQENYERGQKCTPKAFNRVVGLRACVGDYVHKEDGKESVFPRRWWLHMDKVDTTLETYEMELKLVGKDEAKSLLNAYPREFTFDTPGSQFNRRVHVRLTTEGNKKIVDADVADRNIHLEGELNMKKIAHGKEYTGDIEMKVDDRKTYTLSSTLKRIYEESKMKTTLEAISQQHSGASSEEPVKLNAGMEMSSYSDMHVYAKMEGLSEKPTETSLKVHVPSKGNTGKALFEYNWSCSNYDVDLKTEYHNSRPDFKVHVHGKFDAINDDQPATQLRMLADRETKKFTGGYEIKRRFELTKSLHAASNFELRTVEKHKHTEREYKADLKYGAQLAKEASLSVTGQYDRATYEYIYKSRVEAPEWRLAKKGQLKYRNERSSDSWRYEVQAEMTDLQGNDKRSIGVKIHDERTKRPMSWTGEVTAQLSNERRMRLLKEFREQPASGDERKMKSRTVVQWADDKQAELIADVSMLPYPASQYKYSVEGELQLTGVTLADKDKFRFHKTVEAELDTKAHGFMHMLKKYKYRTWLSTDKHDEYVFDVTIDYRHPQREEFRTNARFTTHTMGPYDYRLDADIMRPKSTIKIERDNKQWARMHLHTPNEPEDIKYGGLLEWDLDTDKKKEIALDWHTTFDRSVTPVTRQHTMTFLTNFNKEHKWHMVVKRQPSQTPNYLAENTYTIDNEKVLCFNVKRYIDTQVDSPVADQMRVMEIEFLTHKPHLDDRHFVLTTKDGNLAMQHGHVIVAFENKLDEKKRAQFEVQYRSRHTSMKPNVGLFMIDFQLLDKYQTCVKSELGTANGVEFNGETLVRWAHDKEMSKKMKLVYKPQEKIYQFEAESKSPFEGARQVDIKFDRRCTDMKCTTLSHLNRNNERVYGFEDEVQFTDDSIYSITERITKMMTNSEKLGDIRCHIQNKNEKGKMIQAVSLHWSTDKNEFYLRREYNTHEMLYMWAARVKDVIDARTRLNVQSKGEEKRIEVQHKYDEKTYNLNARYDGETKRGTVKVIAPDTPFDGLATSVEETEHGQYRIHGENSNGARLEGTFVVQRNMHVIKTDLRFEGIEQPFQVVLESDTQSNTARKWKLMIVKMHDSIAESRPYGLTYHSNRKSDEFTMKSLTMHLPAREPHFVLRFKPSERDISEIQFEGQLDRKQERTPTRVIYRDASNNAVVRHSLQLSDPVFEHSLKAEMSFYRDMETNMQPCPSFMLLTGDELCNGITYNFTFGSGQTDLHVAAYKLNTRDRSSNVLAFESKSQALKHHQVYYVFNNNRLMHSEIGAQLRWNSESNKPQWSKYALQLYRPSTPGADNVMAVSKIVTPTGEYTLEMSRDPSLGPYGEIALSYTTKSGTVYTLARRIELDREQQALIERREPVPIYQMVPNMEKGFTTVLELRRGKTVLYQDTTMINEREYKRERWHRTQSDKKSQDELVKIWLPRDDLMKIRFHRSLKTITEVMRDMFGRQDTEEINSVVGRFVNDVVGSNQQVITYFKNEPLPQLQRMVSEMKENEVSLQEELGVSSEMYEYISEQVELLVEAMNIKLDEMQMAYEDFVANNRLQETWEQFWEEFMKTLKETFEMWLKLWEEFKQAWEDFWQTFFEMWKKIYEKIIDWLNDNEELADVKYAIEQMFTKLAEWTNMQGAKEKFDEFIESMKRKYGYYGSYQSSYLSFGFVKKVYDWIEPALSELATIDLHEISSKLLNAEFWTGDWSHKKIKDILPRVEYYEVNNKREEVEIAVPLPGHFDNFRELFEYISSIRPIRALTNYFKDRFSMFDSNTYVSEEIWQREGARAPRQRQDVDDISPRHRSIAYVIGKQLVTFDGRAYGIETECHYTLARDFYENRFKLNGHFGRDGIRSVTMHFRNKKISVHLDGRAHIDGQQTSLPWQLIDTFDGESFVEVLRTDNRIRITIYDGIRVTVDLYNRLVEVDLPSNYYGHSNGLLGSNDLEHHNDFNSPNEHADKWLAEGRCNVKSLSSEPSTMEEKRRECDSAFRARNSPLRSCFNRVAPRAYHNLCMAGHYCNATVAYAYACQERNIALQVPQKCLSCQNPKEASRLLGGENVEVDGIDKKVADVVFVVHENPCMGDATKQRLINDISSVVSKATRQGINVQQSRFGVVGFGGEGVHKKPHFHTCGNNVLCSKEQVSEAIESLEFTPQSSTFQYENVDPLWAVDYTVRNYPFRANTAKVVILLTCTECGNNRVDYYNLQAEMLSANIQMHVLTRALINVEETGEDVEVMGYNAQSMFTNRGEQRELRAKLVSPHDSCTVLAQELNGTVWTVHDGPAPPDSLRYMSEHVNFPSCQICACEEHIFAPRTTCVSCDVPTPQSLTTDGNFFNMPFVKLRQGMKKAHETLNSDMQEMQAFFL